MLTEIDKQIINAIKNFVSENELSKTSIMIKTLEQTFDSFNIKEMLWYLISKGDIIFTNDRKLRLPKDDDKFWLY